MRFDKFKFLVKLILINIFVVEAYYDENLYNNSLESCMLFASEFGGDCSQDKIITCNRVGFCANKTVPVDDSETATLDLLVDSEYMYETVEENITIVGSGYLLKSCTWTHRLCVKCFEKEGKVKISVDSNGMPDHCFFQPYQYVYPQNINFSVNWMSPIDQAQDQEVDAQSENENPQEIEQEETVETNQETDEAPQEQDDNSNPSADFKNDDTNSEVKNEQGSQKNEVEVENETIKTAVKNEDEDKSTGIQPKNDSEKQANQYDQSTKNTVEDPTEATKETNQEQTLVQEQEPDQETKRVVEEIKKPEDPIVKEDEQTPNPEVEDPKQEDTPIEDKDEKSQKDDNIEKQGQEQTENVVLQDQDNVVQDEEEVVVPKKEEDIVQDQQQQPPQTEVQDDAEGGSVKVDPTIGKGEVEVETPPETTVNDEVQNPPVSTSTDETQNDKNEEQGEIETVETPNTDSGSRRRLDETVTIAAKETEPKMKESDATNEILCNKSMSNNDMIPPSAQFEVGESNTMNLDLAWGIALNGVPIFQALDERGVDPFDILNESDIYGEKIDDKFRLQHGFDWCLGRPSTDKDSGTYHYYSGSPCIAHKKYFENMRMKMSTDIYQLLYYSHLKVEPHRSIFGLSKDGRPIYMPFYKRQTLYDNCDLDICNGKVMENGSYVYVTTMNHPYVMGCFGSAKPTNDQNEYYAPQTCSKNQRICTPAKTFAKYLYLSAISMVILSVQITI